jgi:carboxyl-terminal processing protease
MGLEATAARLRGEAGSEVLVTLREAGSPAEREVRLKRSQVDLQPVRHRRLREGRRQLGYLRITQFSEAVPQLVREAIEDLNGGDGGPVVEGLILDLRNNSGGLVSAGVAVADELLDGGAIVETDRCRVTIADGFVSEITNKLTGYPIKIRCPRHGGNEC